MTNELMAAGEPSGGKPTNTPLVAAPAPVVEEGWGLGCESADPYLLGLIEQVTDVTLTVTARARG